MSVPKEKRLGRGLEALLGKPVDESLAQVAPQPAPTAVAPNIEVSDEVLTQDDSGQRWLALRAIKANPYQPRRDFGPEEIESLRSSITEHGVLQPLVVRQVGDGFELIAGERRLRAAQAAGWERVPVQIREADDRQMAELAIVENVQRKDLNPIEKALSFERYIDEYNCTQEELSVRIQVERSTITNLLRLLELPEAVKDRLMAGKIGQGHARALLPLGDEEKQVAFSARIEKEGLSVRATEAAVSEAIEQEDTEPLSVVDQDGQRAPAGRPRSAQLASLERDFKEALGTRVELRQTSRGKGKIIIHFKNNDEFERLSSQLRGHGRPKAESA